jgi:predicted TIM-barrel fold metal-dependent hydrolase
MKKIALRFLFRFICLLLISSVSAQIRTTQLPEVGFEERIKKVIDEMWIIDTHEHLQMEEDVIERNKSIPLDFTHLFQQYISDDLVSAGYAAAVSGIVENQGLPLEDRWALFEYFWEATKNTGYGRVPLIAARDLYGIEDINGETVAELSEKITNSYQPGWYRHVLKDKARIELSICDIGHRELAPAFYRHVERFDNFIWIFSASQIKNLGRNYDIEVAGLEDFHRALKKAFKEGLEYGMVGVKSGLAYSRPIHYADTPADKAKKVFIKIMEAGEETLTFEEVKPLQDYMMHRVLDLAQENDLPVQIHTGLHAGGKNEIRNSHPCLLTNLFNEYPDIKFCIFHSSYPYGSELSVLAKNYPNVFIDMCWSEIISPYYTERYLHEGLDAVPSNKIMAFGGDYNHVESVYGHSVMARAVVTKVLTEKVAGGYFSEEEAVRIAHRLFRDNALEIFKLKGHSRELADLPVKEDLGFTGDLWKMVRTNSGIIRDWMVIGPFPIGTENLDTPYPPAGFDKVYPPEKEIDFTKSYQGVDGDVSWQHVKSEKSGILNFKSIYPAGVAIAYAYAEVVSPDKRKIKITFGSDDGAVIWVNGVQVYKEHAWRALRADGNIIDVELNKGKNSILVKVEDRWMNWEMMMRLIDFENEMEVVEW